MQATAGFIPENFRGSYRPCKRSSRSGPLPPRLPLGEFASARPLDAYTDQIRLPRL
jgi:hypothetical protein